jgi:hypothetical protein
VQGGKRQFFNGGDRMPHALLQGEPSVWQKLKGDAPTYRVATVWRLVDYDTPAPNDPSPPAAALDLPAKTPDKTAAPDDRGNEGGNPESSAKD